MIIRFDWKNKSFEADLSLPIDISIPFIADQASSRCYASPPFKVEPVIQGDFIGSLIAGGPVNHHTIQISPHGNGTHTECSSHIFLGHQTIAEIWPKKFMIGQLITVNPLLMANGDYIISLDCLTQIDLIAGADAIIIRSLPNNDTKLTQIYTNTNPIYFTPSVIRYFREYGFNHLLADLPSVDKEKDEGKLSAHKAWWNDEANGGHRTITELIYVPDAVLDGIYLLNLQITMFPSDAAPSLPILYALKAI